MADKFVCLSSEIPQTAKGLTLLQFQMLLYGHFLVSLSGVAQGNEKILYTLSVFLAAYPGLPR